MLRWTVMVVMVGSVNFCKNKLSSHLEQLKNFYDCAPDAGLVANSMHVLQP